MYDIGSLFDCAKDIGVTIEAFKRIVLVELGYRNLGNDFGIVIDDIINTSLMIALRGTNNKEKFALLQDGIKSIAPFIYKGSYYIENAQVDSAKAAYLAMLIKNSVTEVHRYSGILQELKDLTVSNKLPAKLNKLKKSNPEAFYYWYLVGEML